jgi:hypothetical protein
MPTKKSNRIYWIIGAVILTIIGLSSLMGLLVHGAAPDLSGTKVVKNITVVDKYQDDMLYYVTDNENQTYLTSIGIYTRITANNTYNSTLYPSKNRVEMWITDERIISDTPKIDKGGNIKE